VEPIAGEPIRHAIESPELRLDQGLESQEPGFHRRARFGPIEAIYEREGRMYRPTRRASEAARRARLRRSGQADLIDGRSLPPKAIVFVPGTLGKIINEHSNSPRDRGPRRPRSLARARTDRRAGSAAALRAVRHRYGGAGAGPHHRHERSRASVG